MLELLPEFERSHRSNVDIVWGATAALVKEIEGGSLCDLAVLTAEAVDDFIRRGTIVAGSRVDLASSAIGLAVRQGAARPDIATPDALKRTLLAAKSVAHSRSGLSGMHFPTVLERLGITDAMKGRILIPQVPTPIGEVIARGEAEIGVQQISELMPVPGIEIVGPLPGDLQRVSTFSAGLMAAAREPDAAQALVRFAAERFPPLLGDKGLSPP